MTKNLTVNLQNDLFVAVNRQRDPPPATPYQDPLYWQSEAKQRTAQEN